LATRRASQKWVAIKVLVKQGFIFILKNIYINIFNCDIEILVNFFLLKKENIFLKFIYLLLLLLLLEKT
jgi:hypothetical protein